MFSFWSSSKPSAAAQDGTPAAVHATVVGAPARQATIAAPPAPPQTTITTATETIARTAAETDGSAPTLPRTRSLLPTDERSAKQLGFFLVGAGFLAMSTLVTRRAVARKQLAAMPRFYSTAGTAAVAEGGAAAAAASSGSSGNSPLMAIEALNLATLNVAAFGVMLAGGVAWALDVSSLDDLRAYARRHIGPPGGKTDAEAEQEVEEWMARVLARKAGRPQNGRDGADAGGGGGPAAA